MAMTQQTGASLTLCGFLGVSGGDVLHAAHGQTRYAYYNVYVVTSNGSYIDGRLRMYSSTGIAAPDNSIWFGVCRVQAPSNPADIFTLESSGIGSFIPGTPDLDSYGDSLPEIDTAIFYTLGHVASGLTDLTMDNGLARAGFRVSTSEYLNRGTQPSTVV